MQPFVTRMASIPDLDIIKKTYAKLREVTFTYVITSERFWKQFFHKGRKRFFSGKKFIVFLSQQV